MSIGGVVESLTNRRMDGWAIDTSSDQSPILDLCIAGLKVKKIRTQRPRLGFEHLVSGGRVGFRFRLHRSLLRYVHTKEALTVELQGVQLPVKLNLLRPARGEHRRDPKEIPELLRNNHFITKQGELRLSIRLDKRWQDEHFGFYEEAREKFKKWFGYDLYLVGGALLGLTREGELIASDDDLDTAYLSRHSDTRLIKEEFIKIHETLRANGEWTAIAPRRRNFLKWRCGTSKALIDVFPSWKSGEYFFQSASIMAPCADAIEEGFKEVPWYGHTVLVPKEADTILAGIYGPSWRTPDPLFQWVVRPEVKRVMRRITLNRSQVAQLNARL